MNYRWTAGVLAAAALLCAAGAQGVVLRVGTVSAQPGAIINLPVEIDTEGVEITGVVLDLYANLNEVRFLAGYGGLPDCTALPEKEASQFDYHFRDHGVRAGVLSRLSEAPIPTGEIFVCRMAVVAQQAGRSPVTCDNVDLFGPPIGVPVEVTCEEGAIIIEAPATQTRPPTITPTPAPTGPQCALDLNGNGATGINELITAVNQALDGCPAPPAATATATPVPTGGCPYDFSVDNSGAGEEFCGYAGTTTICEVGARAATVGWFANGTEVFAVLDDGGGPVLITGTRTSSTSARVERIAGGENFEDSLRTGGAMVLPTVRSFGAIVEDVLPHDCDLEFEGVFEELLTRPASISETIRLSPGAGDLRALIERARLRSRPRR